MRTARTKPERSRPLPRLAPTDILAEKKVKPSIIKNMGQNFFLAVFGTGSRE